MPLESLVHVARDADIVSRRIALAAHDVHETLPEPAHAETTACIVPSWNLIDSEEGASSEADVRSDCVRHSS